MPGLTSHKESYTHYNPSDAVNFKKADVMSVLIASGKRPVNSDPLRLY
jgi:hypothetical protein